MTRLPNVVGGASLRNPRNNGFGLMAIVFAVALTVRLVFVLFAFSTVAGWLGLNTKSDGYESIAHNLIAGHGFCFHPDYAQTTLRVPGYSYLVAAIYWLFGERLTPVQVVQSILSAGSAALLAGLALRAFGRRAAWRAGLAFCFYPGDWVAVARYVAEPLAVLALLICVWVAGEWCRNPTHRRAVVVGILFGLLGQIKELFAFLSPVLLLVMFATTGVWRDRRRAAISVACLLLPVVVIAAPWVARGYRLTGHLIYPSTLGGQGLMDGYFVTAHLGSGKSVRELLYEGRAEFRRLADAHGIELDPKDRYSWRFRTALDEYRMDQVLKQEFIKTVQADPLDWLKRSVLGLARFWYLGPTLKSTLFGAAVHVPIVLLGLIGGLVAWRRGAHDEIWLWLTVIGYLNVLNGVVDPLVRYAVPAVPFLIILGASLFVPAAERAGNDAPIIAGGTEFRGLGHRPMVKQRVGP